MKRSLVVLAAVLFSVWAGNVVYAQATPSPTPCAASLMIKDVTAAGITTTRSTDLFGWYYQFLADDNSVGYGYLYDNENEFINSSASTAKGLAIKIWPNHETVAIQAGDSITVSGLDGSDNPISGTIYLPAFTAATEIFIRSDWRACQDISRCTLSDVTSPTPTPTATPSPTASPTPSPEPSATPSPTAEPSATPTPSPEPTLTPEPSPSPSPTAEPSATPTAEPSATPTAEPTATPSPTPSVTPSRTPTATPTAAPSATATPTPSPSVTPSPTKTATPTATPVSPTPSPTVTPWKYEQTGMVIGSQMIYGRDLAGTPRTIRIRADGYGYMVICGANASGTPVPVRVDALGHIIYVSISPTPTPVPTPTP